MVTDGKQPKIRELFKRYDRCDLTLSGFEKKLSEITDLTDSYKILKNKTAGNFSFKELSRSLQLQDDIVRRRVTSAGSKRENDSTQKRTTTDLNTKKSRDHCEILQWKLTNDTPPPELNAHLATKAPFDTNVDAFPIRSPTSLTEISLKQAVKRFVEGTITLAALRNKMVKKLGTLTPSQDKILNRASVDSSISFYDLWKPFIVLDQCQWTHQDRCQSRQNLIDAPEESDLIAWEKPGYQANRQEKSTWSSSVDAQVGSGDIINWHKSTVNPRGLHEKKPSKKRMISRHQQITWKNWSTEHKPEPPEVNIDELRIQTRKRFQNKAKMTYGSQGVENLLSWDTSCSQRT